MAFHQSLILLLIYCVFQPCFALYSLLSNYNLSSYGNITTLSLAPTATTTQDGIRNLAVGTDKGKIIFFNTENQLRNGKSYTIFNGTAIISMDWGDDGLFVSTNSIIKFVSSYDATEIMSLILPSEPLFTTYGYSKTRQKVMVAVSYQSKLQIYENSAMVMSFPLVKVCKAMSFDRTGRLFYYFDNFKRYVINVANRSVFASFDVESEYVSTATSEISEFFNVSVVVDQRGLVTLWDNQQQLKSFQSKIQINKNCSNIVFTLNCRIILTSNKCTKSLQLTQINLRNFSSQWKLYQSIALQSETVPNRVQKIDSTNENILVLTDSNLLYLYQLESENQYLYIIIVMSIFGVFCCCGVTICGIGYVISWRGKMRRKEEQNANLSSEFYSNPDYINQNVDSSGPNNQSKGDIIKIKQYSLLTQE